VAKAARKPLSIKLGHTFACGRRKLIIIILVVIIIECWCLGSENEIVAPGGVSNGPQLILLKTPAAKTQTAKIKKNIVNKMEGNFQHSFKPVISTQEISQAIFV